MIATLTFFCNFAPAKKYIDEHYSGNGVHEYKYYDRHSKRWSDKACKDGDATRCVKMDCHLPDTHFTLLGFFKEPNYGEWMEQLFKHEGDCVWTDDEYRFMQQNREAWPNGCTPTIYTDPHNHTIYFDVKPAKYGSMNIGLYIDELCIHDYKGSMTAEQVLQGMYCGGYLDRDRDDEDGDNGGERDDGNEEEYYKRYIKAYKQLTTRCDMCGGSACYKLVKYFNSSKVDYFQDYLEHSNDTDWHPEDFESKSTVWSLKSDLKNWNAAFDVFKQCLPCKAFALTEIVAVMGYEANADGDRYDDGPGGDHNDHRRRGRGRRRRRVGESQNQDDDDQFHW